MSLVSSREEGPCQPEGFYIGDFPSALSLGMKTPATCSRDGGDIFISPGTMSTPQHLTWPLNYCAIYQATVSLSLPLSLSRCFPNNGSDKKLQVAVKVRPHVSVR